MSTAGIHPSPCIECGRHPLVKQFKGDFWGVRCWCVGRKTVGDHPTLSSALVEWECDVNVPTAQVRSVEYSQSATLPRQEAP